MILTDVLNLLHKIWCLSTLSLNNWVALNMHISYDLLNLMKLTGG